MLQTASLFLVFLAATSATRGQPAPQTIIDVSHLKVACLAAERVRVSTEKNDSSLANGAEDRELSAMCVGYVTGLVDALCSTMTLDLQKDEKTSVTIKCEGGSSINQVIRAFLRVIDDDPSIAPTSPAKYAVMTGMAKSNLASFTNKK